MTPKDVAFRVYYEDTDAGGVMYYSNYLKFAERARTEYLRQLGFSQELLRHEGVLCVVRKVNVDYLKPAKLDDLVLIESTIITMTRVSLTMKQWLRIKENLLCLVQVKLACVDTDLRIRKWPDKMAASLKKGAN